MFKKEFNTEPEMRTFKNSLGFEFDVLFEGYAYSHEKRKVMYFFIYKRIYDKTS